MVEIGKEESCSGSVLARKIKGYGDIKMREIIDENRLGRINLLGAGVSVESSCGGLEAMIIIRCR